MNLCAPINSALPVILGRRAWTPRRPWCRRRWSRGRRRDGLPTFPRYRLLRHVLLASRRREYRLRRLVVVDALPALLLSGDHLHHINDQFI